MKILISAAETSSDAHGAELLKALRVEWAIRRKISEETAAHQIDAFGIGGPKLRDAGLRILVDARELLAMGFLELISHLPKILRALRVITAGAQREKPDLAVVIDYPDFHFRLAGRLRSKSIPVIYFIPPKVWAWRKRRIRILKKVFAKILCIFPFEEEFYKKAGIPAVYIGNPLLDELQVNVSKEEARSKLKLLNSDLVLVIMPGSRASEIKRHLELLLESALICARELHRLGRLPAPLKVLIPFADTAPIEQIRQEVQTWQLKQNADSFLELRVSQGDSAVCMTAADAGLIKSGTSTLEAGFLKCPHVITYKTNWITGFIFKYLIRYRGPVGLVNLVAGWTPGAPYLVNEILLENATPDRLGEEAVNLFNDEKLREKLLLGFERLRQVLLAVKREGDLGPSRRAAAEILDFVQGRLK